MDLIKLRPIYGILVRLYSFAMKGEDDFCFILGKHRNNNVASNVVKIQKFKNDAYLYSAILPEDIGEIIPNVKNVVENDVFHSLSTSNVLYKITDREEVQVFDIDSLTHFSSPILSIVSDNEDRLYILKKDTIFDLNDDLVTQNNITAFTINDQSILTKIESKNDAVIANELLIYPNPNKGKFYLETPFKINEINKIQVFDNIGNLVFEPQINESFEIDLNNAKKGIYLVKLILDDKVLSQKVILE